MTADFPFRPDSQAHRDFPSQRAVQPHPGPPLSALHALLEARSVAIVGASARPGAFGARMLAEVGRSSARPVIYPVNPRYHDIDGHPCYPSLADLPGPVDLVMLGVPDAALEGELRRAAALGCHSALIFGNAYEPPPTPAEPPTTPPTAPPASPSHPHPTQPLATASSAHPPSLRQRLATIALSAGMELCGAGCMGFANVGYGLRAMGYVEPDPLPAGPVALVTHSGSVFSAMLRSRRAFGFTLAVSSGQELVTAAPAYLSYALNQPHTKVLALVLEAMRRPDELRTVLALAAARDIPVILLTAGQSAGGRAMVAAHSGALAGSDGGWEALTRAYGIHRVADLAEMCDTLELFALSASARHGSSPHRDSNVGPILSLGQQQGPHAVATPTGAPSQSDPISAIHPVHRATHPLQDASHPGRGIATVHDSGLERAHAADVADQLGVPFAQISEATKSRLAGLLDPGLLPANPLDVWGTGASTRTLFAESMAALAADEAVDAVALAVDLVTELDGDDSYPLAVLDVAQRTSKPLAVISSVPSAIDHATAARLRRAGIGVLEGMRPGMRALRHLLDHLHRVPASGSVIPTLGTPPVADTTPAPGTSPVVARRARAADLLARCDETGAAQLELLGEYGLAVARTERVTSAGEALAAAARIGYPVALKTDQPGITHKSDVHGVVLGIPDAAILTAAYGDLAARLGPAALVCQTIPPGTELALGMVRDPDLGPLIVVGAGGTLVELIADRAVALPPLTHEQAAGLLDGLKVARLLAGVRGQRPADLGAIATAIVGLAELACELGERIDAIDINPVICGPDGAVAVDVLVIRRSA